MRTVTGTHDLRVPVLTSFEMSSFKQLEHSLKMQKIFLLVQHERNANSAKPQSKRLPLAPHKLIEHACSNKVDLLTHTRQGAGLGWGIHYFMLEVTLVKLLNKCVAVRAITEPL